MQPVSELVDVIREHIAARAVLIVFDNVWDADMFRPGSLDIFPGKRYGTSPPPPSSPSLLAQIMLLKLVSMVLILKLTLSSLHLHQRKPLSRHEEVQDV